LQKNIAGATSAPYSFTAHTTDNGKQFRAVFTNTSGTITSMVAVLTVTASVGTPPVVTTQPINQTVAEGQAATFTAIASGSPTPTVQWQMSVDNGATWNNISGAISTTYTFTAQAGDTGKQYRAVFTNSYGTAVSTAASLTVTISSGSAPTITQQPIDQSASIGQSVSFSAAAIGTPTPTVQWQVSTNGKNWKNIAGATSISYSFTAQKNNNGYRYRAIFTNLYGSVTTNIVTLTVK
jgi:hypothetical protein